jgi:arsenate reductase
MAEAFLRKYAGDQFEVYSAGLTPKPINPLTIKVMEEIGFDMSSQYSKPLTIYLGKIHFGYLITVCTNAENKCPIFPGMGIRLHWPFDDPAEFEGSEQEKLLKFREVRDQIDQKVHEWALEFQGV